jgi:DNA-directed RNA polymerase subunit M/transcription elongation factor TFIIS
MSEIDIRNKGKIVLSEYLDKEKNIEIIENNIYQLSVEKKSFNNIYFETLYEVCYFLNIHNIKKVNTDLKNKKVMWNNDEFLDEKNKQKEKDDFLTNPFDVEEGIEKCNKCGSKRTYSISKQVRSADEGFSTFSHCLDCNKRWRNN